MAAEIDLQLAVLNDAIEDRNARIVALEALVVTLLARTHPDPAEVMELIGRMLPSDNSGRSGSGLRIAARQHAALLLSDARDAARTDAFPTERHRGAA